MINILTGPMAGTGKGGTHHHYVTNCWLFIDLVLMMGMEFSFKTDKYCLIKLLQIFSHQTQLIFGYKSYF